MGEPALAQLGQPILPVQGKQSGRLAEDLSREGGDAKGGDGPARGAALQLQSPTP